MQIKLFTIPIGDSGAALEEMVRFLRTNKINAGEFRKKIVNDS